MSLFAWTGNPFVDNGIAAMLAHSRKLEPAELTADDIKAVGELMMSVYLTPGWLKSMQNIFPNGAFTNPAFASCRPGKVEELIAFLEGEIKPLEVSGGCICCGRREALRLAKNDKRNLPNNMMLSKTYIPLNGGVLNFFPSGVYGADVCANCVYAIQCSPLNFYTSNYDEKRFVVIHSNRFRVLLEWSQEARKEVLQQVATGNFTGCFNEGINNATNAFFHIVEKIFIDHVFDDLDGMTTVRLYHFDNYNQPKPQPLRIYDMPAPVFKFLAKVRNSTFYEDWRRLLRNNFYFIKNGKSIGLPTSEEQQEERKSQKNFVLEKLLKNERISRHFCHRFNREPYVRWGLVAMYLREVMSMPDERIQTIKKVADELADMIQAKDNLKRLGQLERASNYASFRNILLRFTHERVTNRSPEPLFTLDEYTDHLFPVGALGWKETQDLLLFGIYEKLHPWLISKDPSELPEPSDDTDADAGSNEKNDV